MDLPQSAETTYFFQIVPVDPPPFDGKLRTPLFNIRLHIAFGFVLTANQDEEEVYFFK